jgi:type IV pilus assembly protein PilY1
MNSFPTSPPRPSKSRIGRALRCVQLAALVAFGSVAVVPTQAATALADQPLFATPNVPGNLALLLSVEFPTAVSVAHTIRTYLPASEYLGFFDPKKCYDYTAGATDAEKFFTPSAFATAHVCTGKWSGNFLNWASMQTIDPFRWVLTGGYRVIDEASRTVVEKAWASGQGGTGNFPDSVLSSGDVAGATPFSASAGSLYMRIQGLGNKMRFTTPDTSGGITFSGNYYNNNSRSGTPILTRTDTSIDFDWGNGSPAPVVQVDNFSAQWTATITVPTTGSYYFRLKADDRAELFINGVSVISQTSYQGMAYQTSAPIALTAGQTFTVRMDFREDGGGSGIQLQWQKPADAAFSTMGAPVASPYGTATAYNGSATTPGTVFEAFMRAKVCDATLGATYVESNCTAYGSNYKPEGLIQKYSNKIRYSAFGYLNDSNILRDGGVLRAQQKFVGPLKPVPGSAAVTNTAGEWDATTGVYTINPDSADATSTAAIFGAINNSGVINYLNKFGEITQGNYKTYDNVSELYYAAIRYFKALPDVPEWTAVGAASAATKAAWADGFPVITSPADPILYSCQKNFVLGIGDVNTHADKNLPGRLSSQTGSEPSLPAAVSSDTSVDAVAATDKIGALEGLGTIGSNATYNTAAIAGLAYDSHVKDIRPDDASKPNTSGKQTIDTYWVDVQEYQTYVSYNQFYLATKYGGFTVPTGFDPNTSTALTDSWWHTNPDTLGANMRPDNYFAGGRPDLVKAGLDAAFSKIAAAITAYTTSFSTSLPQVALSGNSSFSSKYDANSWTGEITASNLSFDASTNAPTLVEKWKFTDVLATQLAGTGWNLNRRVFTWNGTAGVAFRASGATQLAAADLLALDTSYTTGDDKLNYLNYLRGDRTNEVGSTVTGSTHAYRARTKLLGDVVGSKARPVAAPSFPFSDATNPGYGAFKTTWATRRTVVYVGSNDGMMHAINGALLTAPTSPATLEADANAGKEMFAYVPRVLFQGPNGTPNVDGMAALGNPAFIHHYMVNATPSVNDVDFARVPDSSNVRQTPASTTSDWRTVLIGGLGKGGKSYYALDVTDPVSMATAGTEDSVATTKVLWEFGNSTAGMSGELGYTYGDPLVMKTQKYGWVVMFLSGYNNANGQGYFIFVNPKTGALLEKVSTGTGTPSSDAGLAHANAFIVDASDGTADAVYAGDLLGNLWRLDVTGTGSYSATGKLVKLASLTDASTNPQPVTSRPSIEVSPSTKKRFVMVGTGRLLDSSDIASTQGQTFYAIADGFNATFNATPFPPATTPAYPITRAQLIPNTNALVGATFDPATQVGWYEELGVDTGTPAIPAIPASGSAPAVPMVPAVPGTGIAWRVTSDSTTLAGSVAFAATLPNGSVCSPSGNSRVYARDSAAATTGVKALVNGVLAPVLYVSVTGNVTDLRYLSVRGKAVLLSGADTGELKPIDINPLDNLSLRRLNWRELQVVD